MHKIGIRILFCSFFFIQTYAGSLVASKQVLVAGGAGFLGSHLCERLLNDGAEVICLDNLYTGSMKNISHLLDCPRFKFVLHNIMNPYDPGIHLDEIYNLACPASPIHYQKDPVYTLLTSVIGIHNLLQLATKNDAKIFHSSTSEVYGDPLEHPQKETYWGNVNPDGIRACYDEGKRCAETLCFDYHRQHAARVKVARIFNTYGPRMDNHDGRVISNFIVQALSGAPITVFGNGNQTRSFCYVDDLIDAIVALMQTDDTFTGPVNLGTPIEFTILELAIMIIEMTGTKSHLVFLPLPQDDPKQRLPDIALARKILGWEPKVFLHEGLARTIGYFACQTAIPGNEQDLPLKP